MPNNFQPHIPDFQRGERLSAARLNELADAIAKLLWHKQQATNTAFGVKPPLEIIGKLDNDLPAATIFGTDPGEAVMSVWFKDQNGNLIDSGRNENIKQRFTSAEDKAAGDEVRAAWIEGEWVALPGGGSSQIRWGKITSVLGCGWYMVELGTLDGDYDASASLAASGDECSPCGNVTGAGTSGCAMTLTMPSPKVVGSGTSVMAYDPASIVIPLIAGTDCVVGKVPGTPTGSGSGFSGSGSAGATETMWAVLRGFQQHSVDYKERWDCCEPDGPPVLVGKTPVVYIGFTCEEILCEECPE